MIRLEWTDELNTGIEMIDKQHMILVRAINLLGLAVERNSDPELMNAIFETLADYTATHFSYEEEIFEAAGYPESDEHKKTHVAFLERVAALKQQFEAGGDNANDVLTFLISWLKEHILGTDRQYIPYVLGNTGQMRQAG